MRTLSWKSGWKPSKRREFWHQRISDIFFRLEVMAVWSWNSCASYFHNYNYSFCSIDLTKSRYTWSLTAVLLKLLKYCNRSLSDQPLYFPRIWNDRRLAVESFRELEQINFAAFNVTSSLNVHSRPAAKHEQTKYKILKIANFCSIEILNSPACKALKWCRQALEDTLSWAPQLIFQREYFHVAHLTAFHTLENPE